MANISEEKWIEMLEKKADGTYIVKYPKVKSKSGITFDEHLAEIASQDKEGHIKLDGLLKTGLNAEMVGGKKINELLQKPSDIFVTGTYTGNGASSRNISLGFRPSAVLCVGSKDGGYPINRSTTLSWALALDGYPARGRNVNGNPTNALAVSSSGFTVYQEAVEHSNQGVYLNENSLIYHYIAFK